MHFARAIRVLLVLVAALGYLADGARAHMQISGDDTIRVLMCSPGQTRFVDIEIPGEPQDIADKCCADCAPLAAITPDHPALFAAAAHYSDHLPLPPEITASPRSPLWPGAPPNGPPAPHSA